MAFPQLIFPPEVLVPQGYRGSEYLELSEKESFRPLKREQAKEWVDILQSTVVVQLWEELIDVIWATPKRNHLMVAKRFVEEHYPHVAQRLKYLKTAEQATGNEGLILTAFNRAYEVIYELAQIAYGRDIILPRPYTFGTPNTGVQYEWRRKGREFHLEIIPENGAEVRYEYLLCETSNANEGDEGDLIGPFSKSQVVAKFLDWVQQGWL